MEHKLTMVGYWGKAVDEGIADALGEMPPHRFCNMYGVHDWQTAATANTIWTRTIINCVTHFSFSLEGTCLRVFVTSLISLCLLNNYHNDQHD